MKVTFEIQDGDRTEMLEVDFGDQAVGQKQIEGVMESLRRSTRGGVPADSTPDDRISFLPGAFVALPEGTVQYLGSGKFKWTPAGNRGESDESNTPTVLRSVHVEEVMKLTGRIAELTTQVESMRMDRIQNVDARAALARIMAISEDLSSRTAMSALEEIDAVAAKTLGKGMPEADEPATEVSVESGPEGIKIVADGTVGMSILNPTAKFEVPPAVNKVCASCRHEDACNLWSSGIDSGRFNRCTGGSEWQPKTEGPHATDAERYAIGSKRPPVDPLEQGQTRVG